MTFEQQPALAYDVMPARRVPVSELFAYVRKAVANPVLDLYRAARGRRELHALSDRMLRDIGLSRGDIDSLFR
jgi:uncharacterized protein YjiS (DUF1127 family)